MKHLLTLSLLFSILLSANAQNQRPLSGDDILKWNRITEKLISNDGEYVVYKTEPWKGDSKLFISNNKGKEITSFDYATSAKITHDSKFVVFTIKPPADTIRQLKLRKTKKDDMPKNELGIYDLETGNLDVIPNLSSLKIPTDWGGWIAYQVENSDTVARDTVTPDKEKGEKGEGDETKKDTKEAKKNGYKLHLVKPGKFTEIMDFPFVTSYYFAEKGKTLVFETTGDNKDFEPGIFRWDIEGERGNYVISGKGDYKQLTLNKKGTLIAFMADTANEGENDKKDYKLYSWSSENDGENAANEILSNEAKGIADNWEISANGRLSFSKSGKKLFFGTAPIKSEKDTTILQEELPVLDVWTWNEPVLHTQQLKRKSSDMRKTYMAAYDFDTKKMVQLQTEDLSGVSLINKGDAKYALAYSNQPYAVQTMWEGSPAHMDIYLIDMESGERKQLIEDIRANPQASPTGKYLYWYNAMDTCYYTIDMATLTQHQITNPNIIQAANELNDVPNPAGSYRLAGWLKDDDAILIYDRFDIWKVDPMGKVDPVNLTIEGRNTNTAYRLLQLDKKGGRFGGDDKGIDPDKTHYLTGHNEVTRNDGFYKWSIKKPSVPKELMAGEYKLGSPTKAKKADLVIFTLEDFQIFPDIQISDLSFKKPTKVSNANPQQDEFIWGTAELVSWTSLDGRKLEGTLHKPADFDPNKKYPMIVNFYEKSSQGLYGHHIPERGRSTIGYHYYTSNGYLIFNPDVYYKEGYPGEDAFNCVMPGITKLIATGFVNEKAIAAQGHSWGGYQVAYLATRTNLFAAIESGAPVVNMFSAYGGIRWGSGMNRSSQYEHTQSRIGKSIWESPLRYIENSPIFTMDKVQTPILIMHNDNDGAVPWYQGIEYFIALRRMEKPAWLLNYNNADHWPLRVEDKHDFQIRLAQFFDHYLKGAPMPKWMKEGIPATKKGIEFGYELVK